MSEAPTHQPPEPVLAPTRPEKAPTRKRFGLKMIVRFAMLGLLALAVTSPASAHEDVTNSRLAKDKFGFLAGEESEASTPSVIGTGSYSPIERNVNDNYLANIRSAVRLTDGVTFGPGQQFSFLNQLDFDQPGWRIDSRGVTGAGVCDVALRFCMPLKK